MAAKQKIILIFVVCLTAALQPSFFATFLPKSRFFLCLLKITCLGVNVQGVALIDILFGIITVPKFA